MWACARLCVSHVWVDPVQAAWGLLCVPLIPLLLTPIPNLPLYYAGYKVTPAARHMLGLYRTL